MRKIGVIRFGNTKKNLWVEKLYGQIFFSFNYKNNDITKIFGNQTIIRIYLKDNYIKFMIKYKKTILKKLKKIKQIKLDKNYNKKIILECLEDKNE